MTGPETLDVARDAIWTIVIVSSPLMVVGLVVGVVVSLFQALTQIQEQTLIYVPKILAIFATMLLALPFMADALHSTCCGYRRESSAAEALCAHHAHRRLAAAGACRLLHARLCPGWRDGDAVAGPGRDQYPDTDQTVYRAAAHADHPAAASQRLSGRHGLDRAAAGPDAA